MSVWLRLAAPVSLVVALVLAGVAATVWRDSSELRAAEEAGRTARATVAEQVEALLSYSHRSFDQDFETAMAALTPEFRAEYEPTVEAIADRAKSQRRTQRAVVSTVSVVDAAPDRVETLVFVNISSTREGSRREQLMQNRVNVTLVEDGAGNWLIDDLSVPHT